MGIDAMIGGGVGGCGRVLAHAANAILAAVASAAHVRRAQVFDPPAATTSPQRL